MRTMPPVPPYAAISIISAAALAYEVLLTRLFSIVQWHHFAYLVISVALLGYGASGSLVALLRERLVRHFALVFAGSAALFGVSALTCFLLAQRVPFNALEVMWDARQWAYLGLMYFLLLWPFLFAATCVCLSFTAFPRLAHRIYSFDIGGAALGCVAVVAALTVFHPLQVLAGIAGCSTLAAFAAALWSRASFRWAVWVPLGGAGMAAVAAYGLGLELKPSPYKELSQTLRVLGTRVVAERSNALGLLTVVESPQVP
ncbi:MAG: SAM-dependent methyltransferase, partial [Burkholderiales bacterium]